MEWEGCDLLIWKFDLFVRQISFQAELEKLRSLYDSKMKEAKLDLQTQLDKLSNDLDTKWSETLRWDILINTYRHS